jgi:nucleotide-binding universal stress UspA family protein
MYRKILIPVENSAADETILEHIRALAQLTGAELCLLHVADGWVARNYENFSLRESEEMKRDRLYLENLSEKLATEGFHVEQVLALGDPATEIVKVADERKADLIAMSTHGHRLISDFIYGSTADKVRHRVDIPVLMLKARRQENRR